MLDGNSGFAPLDEAVGPESLPPPPARQPQVGAQKAKMPLSFREDGGGGRPGGKPMAFSQYRERFEPGSGGGGRGTSFFAPASWEEAPPGMQLLASSSAAEFPPATKQGARARPPLPPPPLSPSDEEEAGLLRPEKPRRAPPNSQEPPPTPPSPRAPMPPPQTPPPTSTVPHNTNQRLSHDVFLFVFSGVLLLFLMEQFLQMGQMIGASRMAAAGRFAAEAAGYWPSPGGGTGHALGPA